MIPRAFPVLSPGPADSKAVIKGCPGGPGGLPTIPAVAARMPTTIHHPASPRQQTEAEDTATISDPAPRGATTMEAIVPEDTRPLCAAMPETAAGPAGNTSHCHGDDSFFLIF